MSFSSIPDIIAHFKNGQFVIMTDDENRENEGDLMIAAEFATPDKINFMAKYARGLICLAMTENQIQKLKLPMMTSAYHGSGKTETAFTVSIEAKHGIGSGISAVDRALTIATAINISAQANDLICPGHVFPLRANNNGVLSRAGHTEASVDLAHLAKLNSAAVICEIMNDDGTMARQSDLFEFASTHQIKIGSISDLIQYRMSLLPR